MFMSEVYIKNMKLNQKSLRAIPLLLIVLFISIKGQFKLGNTITNIILSVLFIFTLSVLLYGWKNKNAENKSSSVWLLIIGLFLSTLLIIWNLLKA